ncbi:MAG: DUF4230 domain-containing protein [Verrucomicrobia bacterium]|nr:DUF4230 domain-containing protein [Verrucomicrobiota bacterium]
MKRGGWGAAAIFLGIVILLGMGVRACLDLPSKIASRTVTGVREGVAEVFVDLLHVRPEIREGTRVIWGQTAARTEVIVATKKIEVGYDWEHRWLGSRKVIRLTQSFELKAGFDLAKPFWIEMGPAQGEATAHLPKPEILATSPVGDVSYRDEDGWWNKVTDEDRSKALTALAGEARKQGEKGPLLEEAREMTGSRLTDLARAKKIRLQLDYSKL